MSVLSAQHLAIGYHQPEKRVAEGLDLALEAGEFVCLIGPNGAGKSTLMRTFAGLQAPLGGEIQLLGRELRRYSAREQAQHLSMVLTERVNTGLLKAYDLAALGRHPYTDWSGRLTPQDEAVVRWALEVVGAVPLAGRVVNSLSDGERQKVLIARALAQQPDLMLLDEPGAYLDLPRRVEIMGLLRDLAHDSGCAILASTHDLDLALRSADRIWLLSGDGKLTSGAPEDLVLNGAFAATFQSEGIRFDPYSGAFSVRSPSNGRVALSGSGLAASWTRRALERAGFSVSANGSSTIVTVCEDHWLLQQAGQQLLCHSLYDLIAALTPDMPAEQ